MPFYVFFCTLLVFSASLFYVFYAVAAGFLRNILERFPNLTQHLVGYEHLYHLPGMILMVLIAYSIMRLCRIVSLDLYARANLGRATSLYNWGHIGPITWFVVFSQPKPSSLVVFLILGILLSAGFYIAGLANTLSTLHQLKKVDKRSNGRVVAGPNLPCEPFTKLASSEGMTNQPGDPSQSSYDLQNNGSVDIQYAGFVRRFCAFALDISAIMLVVLSLLYLVSFVDHAGQSQWGPYFGYSIFSVVFCLWLLVGCFFEALPWQGSAGKKMLGLRVVTTGGSRLSPGRSAFRNATKILSGTMNGLGFFWIAASAEKRGWHDYLAGTLVISDTREQARLATEASDDKRMMVLLFGLCLALDIFLFSALSN